jgi:F420-non-reducing hydrogenase iron-sulfur subunit
MAEDQVLHENRVNPEAQLEVPEGWQANIIAFACHYCAFAAADLAGVMRLSYPTNVKIVRLPCTGKLDQGLVLRAFERGCDGVFVAGCLEGQCHFLEGNTNGKKRVRKLHTLLETVSIDKNRLQFYNLSAAMGPRWAEICTEFTEKISLLGPSPIWRALKKKAAKKADHIKAGE